MRGIDRAHFKECKNIPDPVSDDFFALKQSRSSYLKVLGMRAALIFFTCQLFFISLQADTCSWEVRTFYSLSSARF